MNPNREKTISIVQSHGCSTSNLIAILQDIQAACSYLSEESLTVVAEMLGVKSGLGWYMTWQTGWASYDKSFAALFVICLIFTLVTNGLERIKRYLLRWQNGAEK